METITNDNAEGKQDEEKDGGPVKVQESVTRKELVEQLEAHVEYFDKLPNHARYAPVTNADLYYFMMLALNIFKRDLHDK